jgi:hypothetical protein
LYFIYFLLFRVAKAHKAKEAKERKEEEPGRDAVHDELLAVGVAALAENDMSPEQLQSIVDDDDVDVEAVLSKVSELVRYEPNLSVRDVMSTQSTSAISGGAAVPVNSVQMDDSAPVENRVDEIKVGDWVKVPVKKVGQQWARALFDNVASSYLFFKIIRPNISPATQRPNRLRPWIAAHPGDQWKNYDLSLKSSEVEDWTASEQGNDTPHKTWLYRDTPVNVEDLHNFKGRKVKIPALEFGPAWAKHAFEDPDNSFQHMTIERFDYENAYFVFQEDDFTYSITGTLDNMRGDESDCEDTVFKDSYEP